MKYHAGLHIRELTSTVNPVHALYPWLQVQVKLPGVLVH